MRRRVRRTPFRHSLWCATMTAGLFLVGCGGGSGDAPADRADTTPDITLSGVSQKGPFRSGSSVTAYRLVAGTRSDDTFATGTILDDTGSFTLQHISWTGPTEIVVTGPFFDEADGVWKERNITLSAVIRLDATAQQHANVNLLTHLASYYVTDALKKGKSFEKAAEEADTLLAQRFSLPLHDGITPEELNLLEGNGTRKEANAALLKLSAALLSARTETPDTILESIARDLNLTTKQARLAYQTWQSSARDVNLTSVAKTLAETFHIQTPPSQEDVTEETDAWTTAPIAGLIYKDPVSLTVDAMGSQSEQTDLHSIDGIVFNGARHGTVEAYLIGGEYPAFTYTSTECYEGTEDILYINDANETGHIYVTVRMPIDLEADDITREIYSDAVLHDAAVKTVPEGTSVSLTTDPTYGTASLRIEGTKLLLSYTPSTKNTDITDTFTYRLTASYNGCEKHAEGNVTVILKERPVTYLDDINLTLTVKEAVDFQVGLSHIEGITFEGIEHGRAEAYLIGNENPAVKYTSTDCFEGTETFRYTNASKETGVVAVLLTNPAHAEAPDKSFSLYNTASLNDEPLSAYREGMQISSETMPQHGSVSFSHTDDTFVFSYTPDENFSGTDGFTYRITDSVNGCAKSAVGRITLHVRSVIPQPTAQTSAAVRLQMTHPQPHDNDAFAYAVAAEEDILLIGAPMRRYEGTDERGAVFVYRNSDPTASLLQILRAPQSTTQPRIFGYAVAYHEGYLAVSSHVQGDTAANAEVYLYKKEDNGTFSYVASVTSPNDNDNNFAAALAVNGNYLVVGAPNEDDTGAVYVYPINDGRIDNDVYVTLQDDSGDASLTDYGSAVALLNDLICVANPTKASYDDSDDRGEVRVYGKNDKDEFVPLYTIKPPKSDANATMGFGRALHVWNRTLAVGAPNSQAQGKTDSGRVFVYVYDDNDFILLATVEDDAPVESERFGTAVALAHPYLAVTNDSVSGKPDAVRLYQYTDTGLYSLIGTFREIPTISENYWELYQERSRFGASVDIASDTLIAGAPASYAFGPLHTRAPKAGSAYLIECNATAPYWVNYRPHLLKDETDIYQELIASVPSEDYNLSISGSDGDLFVREDAYIRYGGGEEENGDGGSTLSYDAPQDSDGDNRYEMNLTFFIGGFSHAYALTWEVKEAFEYADEGYNSQADWDSPDYYRIPAGSTKYASARRLLIKNGYAYADAKNRIVVFSLDAGKAEKTALYAEAKLEEVNATDEINITDTGRFAATYRQEVFYDVSENGEIAVAGTQRGDEATLDDGTTVVNTNHYIHRFGNDGGYIDSFVVHEGSVTGCGSSDDRCVNDQIVSGDIRWDGQRLLVAYKTSYYEKTSDGNETRRRFSAIAVYDKNASGKYRRIQTVIAPYVTQGEASEDNTIEALETYNGYAIIASSYRNGTQTVRSLDIYAYDDNDKRYEAVAHITPPADTLAWHVSAKNEYLFVEYKRAGFTPLYTDVYRFNPQESNYRKLASLTDADAGATGDFNAWGTTATTFNAKTYLFKRFVKRGESIDYTSRTRTVPDAAYIAVFVWDDTQETFRYLGSFTHYDATADFAASFDAEGDAIFANTYHDDSGENTNYLHTFGIRY